ncbi:MAG: hypothetical protein ABIY55_02820, partial [Kofleriaceae bacterium]
KLLGAVLALGAVAGVVAAIVAGQGDEPGLVTNGTTGQAPGAATQPSSTQSAGAQSNGTQSNGAQSNGTQPNGTPPNGTPPNGASPNGASPNGAQSNGTPAGAPAGSPPVGTPAGSPPVGTPAGSPPAGASPSDQPASPSGTPLPIAAPGEPATITLRFEVDPAGAAITLDGTAVRGHELAVPKDAADHTLRITAPGRVAHDETVRFDESQRLVVQLKRSAEPVRGKPRKDRGNDRIDSQSPYD